MNDLIIFTIFVFQRILRSLAYSIFLIIVTISCICSSSFSTRRLVSNSISWFSCFTSTSLFLNCNITKLNRLICRNSTCHRYWVVFIRRSFSAILNWRLVSSWRALLFVGIKLSSHICVHIHQRCSKFWVSRLLRFVIIGTLIVISILATRLSWATLLGYWILVVIILSRNLTLCSFGKWTHLIKSNQRCRTSIVDCETVCLYHWSLLIWTGDVVRNEVVCIDLIVYIRLRKFPILRFSTFQPILFLWSRSEFVDFVILSIILE